MYNEDLDLDAMQGDLDVISNPATAEEVKREGMTKVLEMFKQAQKSAKDIQDELAWMKQREHERKLKLEQLREAEEQKVAAASRDAFNDIFTHFGQSIKDKHKLIWKQDREALSNPVPFIDPVFDDYFTLVPGQLLTLCAYKGHGKSTNSANIAIGAIKAGKRPLILSNEERSIDMMDKVACLDEGLYYRELVTRTMAAEDQVKVRKRVESYMANKSFMCLDGDDTNGGTTKDDYILNALKLLSEAAVKPDVVIIDYLTNVHATGSTSNENYYFQLGRFLSNLKNLINTLPFPVVMCAQLHSEDKRKGKDKKPASLDTRMVMGADIIRYSTIVLEVRADHLTSTSEVVIHHNRKFERLGTILLRYDKGRLSHCTDEEHAKRVAAATLPPSPNSDP